MDKREVIKTGDVVMFSGNSPTGFLLKTFVSSEWNHSGVAVRFKKEAGKYTVSLTNEGELYILDTNTGIRRDDVFGYDTEGAAFSRADQVFSKYNKIAVRHLRENFRNEELAALTMEFSKKYRGNLFPGSVLPFISVWLGIPFLEKEISPQKSEDMFCSELTAYYYAYCVGPQYERQVETTLEHEIAGQSRNLLGKLFGKGSPEARELFTPGHYAKTLTPNASIFSGEEIIIYTHHADLYYVILQPFVIIVAIMLAIWASLPKE